MIRNVLEKIVVLLIFISKRTSIKPMKSSCKCCNYDKKRATRNCFLVSLIGFLKFRDGICNFSIVCINYIFYG